MNFQSFIFLCLFGFAVLPGCKDSNESANTSGPARPAVAAMSGQYRNELLTYAIDNLNRIEEFESTDVLGQILQGLSPEDQSKSAPSEPLDPLLAAWPEPEMLRQIVDRLNQWIRAQQPPADWRPDPMAAALPHSLTALPQLKDLDRMEFSRFDGYALQEAALCRDIALWARGDALDDLDRAKSLFDWTVRNIQLETDRANRIPQFPWETLLFGRGTATERAWVFILLARQLGIDAAVLGIEEVVVGDGGEGSRRQSQSALTLTLSQRERGPDSTLAPRPWCIGVLIEGNAYLFDPVLGLPIPAPNGITHPEAGHLAIQPATLAQVAAEEKLLRRLDADDAHVYGVKASDLKHVVVLLEASPTSLGRRMKLLESRLVGPQKMILTTSPSTQAEHWKAITQATGSRLWLVPFETLLRRSRLDRKSSQSLLAALLPLYAMPGAPLHRGRMLYLKGQLTGDNGATHYYQMARPSNEELWASSAHPLEKLVYHRGKQDASYWLGLVAYQRGNYQAAIDYFAKRTLLSMPDGPWTNGARYNLARTFEAAGETEKAILQYENNDRSPGYLGDLLRAKWLKEQGGKRKAEGG